MARFDIVREFERARATYKRVVTGADAPPAGPAQSVLYKYTDPDGEVFYLEKKKTSVRSPYTGKTFPAKPQRHTPAQISKDLKSGDD